MMMMVAVAAAAAAAVPMMASMAMASAAPYAFSHQRPHQKFRMSDDACRRRSPGSASAWRWLRSARTGR